jgi:hypothetical protein
MTHKSQSKQVNSDPAYGLVSREVLPPGRLGSVVGEVPFAGPGGRKPGYILLHILPHGASLLLSSTGHLTLSRALPTGDTILETVHGSPSAAWRYLRRRYPGVELGRTVARFVLITEATLPELPPLYALLDLHVISVLERGPSREAMVRRVEAANRDPDAFARAYAEAADARPAVYR